MDDPRPLSRPPSRSLTTRMAIAVVAAAGVLCTGAASAHAAIERPFDTRFSAETRGEIAIAANTSMTCDDEGGANADCVNARGDIGSGAVLNNNNHQMGFVDVDSDGATFGSSTAELTVPAGAEVLFAGLYYGGRTTAGSGGAAAPDASQRGAILIRVPGASGYAPALATVDDSSEIAGTYTAFADLTATVQAAGAGQYTVANVQSGTGLDRYAGWALVVAYRDPAAPPRSLRVFDGLATIVQGDPALELPVTGLVTPADGPVSANVGVVAYEGDRGAAGDRLAFAGQPLSDAANPENNVFNSSISRAGADAGRRDPEYLNQLGFDADLLTADGLLPNGANAATLVESTTLDQYVTQAVTVSIELDPAILEPPPEPSPEPGPTPPAPPPVAPAPEPRPRPARLALEGSGPTRAIRPGSVVAATFVARSTGGRPLRGTRVCVRAPRGIAIVRAPHGRRNPARRACWRLGRVAVGERRRLRVIVRVDRGRSLRAHATASNASSRTAAVAVHIRPLAPRACGTGRGSLARAAC